jgi:hypothetical protein
MEIIDGQIHQPRPWGSWDDVFPAKEKELATEIALAHMDAAGVHAAVWSTSASLGEFAAKRFPDRFAWMTHEIDPEDPEGEEKITNLPSLPGCLGMRLVISGPNRGALAPSHQ